MARSPHSAKALIRELRAVVPDLVTERDDLDGLAVYRTFRFTSKKKKGLDDVITAVADNRIVQHRSITDGVEVTFTHLTGADSNSGFGVAQATDLITSRRARKAKPKQ